MRAREARWRLSPFRIAVIYAAIGSLWILSSDYILFLLISDSVLLTTFQTVKGWLYVAATTGLLYILIDRSFTDTRRSEKALHESEGRYRSLFENNHSVMLLIDPVTADIVDANPAACSFYLYNREELTSKKITDINILPTEEVRQEMTRASQEQNRHFEFRHRLANGEIRDVEVYSGPIEVYGKQLLYSIIYDVTERRQARETLRKQSTELQEQARLLDLAYSSIIAWDMEDGICYWNRAAEELYGWNRAEALGNQVHMLLQTQFPEPLETIKAIVLQAGHWEGELIHSRKDGTWIIVASRWAVQRGMSGIPEKILQINIDVTGLKESERAQRLLAEAGRLLSSALDYEATLTAVLQIALPTMAHICLVDLLEEDGTIRRAVMAYGDSAKSEAVYQLRDFPPGPNEAHPTLKVLRLGQSELIPEFSEAYLEAITYDARHVQILRELKLNSGMVVPLPARGRILGTMLFGWVGPGRHYGPADLALAEELARRAALAVDNARLFHAEQAARRSAEEEVEARRKAEEKLKILVQEKEVLLREVNHRVKNNLQAVSNLLYLQSSYVQDEQTRQQLQEARNRVKSIGLIHEKLYQTQNFLELDFAEYVRSLGEELIRSYKTDTDLIRLRVESDGTAVGVDMAVSLGIIVNELISNALKHAFPDERAGEIRVELKSEADDRLRLAVSDDGAGLPEGQDQQSSGSLGLQLVKMLAGYLDGTVAVEREGGTRAIVTVRPPSGQAME